MPFQNKFELLDEPAIQMFFFGLVVLHSPEGTVWFAETHNEAATHTLSIDVRMKEPLGPDLVLMRRQRRLTHDLKITMVNSAGQPVSPKAFRYVNYRRSITDSVSRWDAARNGTLRGLES